MHFQSSIFTSLGRTVYFYLALASMAFLVVVVEAGSPPIKFPTITEMVNICPLLFSFTRFISTPWIFSFSGFSAISLSRKSLEGSAPILRVFFYFDVSDFFRRGSEVVSEFSQSLLRKLDLFVPSYILGGIRSCLRV